MTKDDTSSATSSALLWAGLALLVYVLSPAPVICLCLKYGGDSLIVSQGFEVFYAPLIRLMSFAWFREAMASYMDLCEKVLDVHWVPKPP